MKSTSSVVLILISIGLFYTFISPQYQKTGSLRAQAAEYKGVLDNVNALVETRDRLMDQYQDFPQTEVERLNKILPNNIDVVSLARDLDTMASQHGITIKTIEVAETKSEDATSILTSAAPTYADSLITFTFISNYPNFKRFMTDLESSLRIADVNSIDFATAETGFNEYTVSIKTYWLK